MGTYVAIKDVPLSAEKRRGGIPVIRAQKKNPLRWTRSEVDAIKDSIRAELNSRADDLDGQTKYLLDNIDTLSRSVDPKDHLPCFLHIIATYVHQQRFGTVPTKALDKIATIAEALLTTHGIDSGSRLSFLASELHVCISQEHLRRGDRFQAAYRHEMAKYSSGGQMAGGDIYYQLLVAAHRLRLGEALQAADLFADAAKQATIDSWWRFCKVNQVRSLRLSGNLAAAKSEIDAHSSDKRHDADSRLEFQWEAACIKVVETDDYYPMFVLVKNGGSHATPAYIAEAHLWFLSCRSDRWLNSLQRPRNAASTGVLRLSDLGHIYRCITTISDCYEPGIAPSIHINKLEDVLAKVHLIPTIDRELLTWAAAARWFERAGLTGFYDMCLAEYRRICIALSGGSSTDVFRQFDGAKSPLLTSKAS